MAHIALWTRVRLLARACGLAFLCMATSNLGAQRADEYELKAAMVYNLLLFVTWPESSFSSSTAPITVGVVGKDPFDRKLDRAILNKRVNGRPVVIKRFATRPKDSECHLLYFAGEGGQKMMGVTNTSPVLTVGECGGFATSGGMIQIDIVSGRGVLTINLGAARDSNLKVSS